MSGAVSYHAGIAAEAAVARLYETGGTPIAARRWRSAAGEIDLIARNGAEVIFIEVGSTWRWWMTQAASKSSRMPLPPDPA